MAHKNQNSKSKRNGCCLRGENLRGGGLFQRKLFEADFPSEQTFLRNNCVYITKML